MRGEGCEWGCREIGDAYEWILGLAQVQTYSASACQSWDSPLTSPGITLTAAMAQPSILELHSWSRLYQDPPCHCCLCIIYQYHYLCCYIGSVSHTALRSNWNWKELMWGVKGNEMTFYWSHPKQSQTFGCKCINGNTEHHNFEHAQYVEWGEARTNAKHRVIISS